MHWLTKLIREDNGQDMVEYGIIAAFISIVAIVALKNIGPLVIALYLWRTRISSGT